MSSTPDGNNTANVPVVLIADYDQNILFNSGNDWETLGGGDGFHNAVVGINGDVLDARYGFESESGFGYGLAFGLRHGIRCREGAVGHEQTTVELKITDIDDFDYAIFPLDFFLLVVGDNEEVVAVSTLFDSILLKDVAKRHKVRNTTDLYNLATYLLSNFCNPISANVDCRRN